MSVLSKLDIERLLGSKPPLIEGYTDLQQQLQPNGFDITLRDIAVFQNFGQLAINNNARRLPDVNVIPFPVDGFITVKAGCYLVTYNEIVNMPANIMAFGRPRSSLLRCGVTIGTAVWDAGYSGRSQSIMVVHNEHGFRVQKNARMLQLVFQTLTSETEGYNGKYQRENIE
jgi:dUTP pyrophosphatase